MCEVMNPDGTPHISNTRSHLVYISEKFSDKEAWFGIEQEYTLFEGRNPLGWPEEDIPRRKDLSIVVLVQMKFSGEILWKSISNYALMRDCIFQESTPK